MSSSFYLELLDGEYLKIASEQATDSPETIHQSVERYLKIMALFGYQATLSDVQVTDSGLWLDLWHDPDFVVFMRRHPEFVSLRSRESDTPGTKKFTQAAAGLVRTKGKKWTSSAFTDVDLVKRVADHLLTFEDGIEEFKLDSVKGIPDDLEKLINSAVNASDRRRLRALLRSIHFFLQNRKLIAEPTGEYSDYIEVLSNAASGAAGSPGSKPLSDQQIEVIANVLSRIKKSVDRDKWSARSAFRETLRTDTWPPEDRIAWHTVVHAWNAANRNSLGVEGMILGSLSDGVHVGLHLDPLEHVFYPAGKNEQERAGIVRQIVADKSRSVVGFPWDPQRFSWARLDEIVTATTLSRDDLVLLRESDADTQRDALERHIKELKLRMSTGSPIPPVLGKILDVLSLICVCVGFELGSVEASAAGVALMTPEPFYWLKGQWVASNLRRAHTDLTRAVSHADKGSIPPRKTS